MLGRSWRLLIIDGHGSYLTQDWFDYCKAHRIILAQFPPHSTHTLQPLDVVMFQPLSDAYTSALIEFTHQSQGLLPVKKGDFFLLFWAAWSKVFTKKDLIRKSFEATGVWPKNCHVVLKRFDNLNAHKREDPEQASVVTLATSNKWIELERILRNAVTDTRSEESKALSEKLHHFQVQNELLNNKNNGLR
jgi:hypothetical protein